MKVSEQQVAFMSSYAKRVEKNASSQYNCLGTHHVPPSDNKAVKVDLEVDVRLNLLNNHKVSICQQSWALLSVAVIHGIQPTFLWSAVNAR